MVDQPAETKSADEVSLEDVLPSFEMHNYMFNRTIYDTEDINNLAQPPNYEDVSSLHDYNELVNQTDPNQFVDPTKNPNALLLNYLDKFQKIDLPIGIQIILTKQVPKVGFNPERENPLRQYVPGDVVCGYVTIENKLKESIPFEMLLVSLEGETTIPNPSNPSTLIKKKFLKTYDLSACFHYGCIDLVSQGVNEQHRLDENDETMIGFTDNRTIYSDTKHKKIFAFKLPHYLLDNTCSEQLPNHLKLPPSFGVNNDAFNGLGKLIKVNQFHGYGRLDRYGSPIKTLDNATDGQSVSYSINVQFIGRKLEFYKKFYNQETKHEYDFISLKNVEYHFRVDTSNVITQLSNPLSDHGEISTSKQLKIIENLVTDKLNENLERKNLNNIGISDSREQDSIIFASNLSNSKKSSQLSSSNLSSELIPVLSDSKTSLMDDHGFSRFQKFNFVKDFFSKIEGNLTLRLTMNKNAQLKALNPKKLKLAGKVATTSSDNETGLKTVSSVTSIASMHSNPTTSMQSPPLLSSFRSVDSVMTINSDNECIYVYMSFTPKNKNSALPPSVTIAPHLKLYNIQSPFPLPITFDNNFIFNAGLEEDNLSNMRRKYNFYYQQLCASLNDLNIGLPRSLYNKVNSLGRAYSSDSTIKKLFEPQTIDLHNQWKFNQSTNVYECEFQVPLILDSKNMEKISSLCVPPSFQQCHLCRLYTVEIEANMKKSKTRNQTMSFPITVA